MKEDLYVISQQKAKEHDIFYHYTNFEALLSIIKSKSIMLSSLEQLNDLEEGLRLDEIKKFKVFVSCFTHEKKESIPLWKLYSKDGYGLRIGLNALIFFEDKKKLFFIDDKTKYYFPSKEWQIRDAIIADVNYVKEPNDYYDIIYPLGEDFLSQKDPTAIGLIKRKAWKFEEETRARVYVDVKPGVSSRLFNKSDETPGVRRPSFDKMFCEISNKIIGEMIITFSPFMSEVIKEAIKITVKKHIPDFKDKNFVYSKLEGKIKNW